MIADDSRGWLGGVSTKHPLGAPAGGRAADAVGDDLLGVTAAGVGGHRSGSSPRSVLTCSSSGRTSVLYASIRTAFAPRTSPATCAAASASESTSRALAVASWTFITDLIWAGIFGSMLWHWSS